MANFDIEPLGDPHVPGVRITGLTRADLDDAEVARRLRDIWIDKGIIVFRGLSGRESHMTLSRLFGTLTTHPSGVACNAEYPELSDINFTPDDANIAEVNGRPVGAFNPWHSDLVYFAEINRGGILRAITPAKTGGLTGFIDQIAAYDRLPRALKDRIENLRVIYWGDFRLEKGRYTEVERVLSRSANADRIIAKRDQFPRVSHPMVYVQAETGRKVLNVSPWFALSIEGMDTPEGLALLDEIVARTTDHRYAYFHRWEAEDMVLWDNWRTIHRACGVPTTETRIMQRTTILGDYGIGRIVGSAAGAGDLEHANV
ncbi:MAG: TauD/TfdA family dioxygenase [Novosphingobium sp.]|nr:TauD/TfdA family dioxygenase [Novosphingobium sp.]